MNFFRRLEEKQRTNAQELAQQQAERQRVMDALGKFGRVSVAQFSRKGLAAAVVYLETHGTVRFVGGNELGEGAFVEAVS
jgi:hypothetical protein